MDSYFCITMKLRSGDKSLRRYAFLMRKLADRQIGERRGRNAIEAVVKRPSSNLFGGARLCDLVIDARSRRLSISISDRKEYIIYI